MIIDEIKNIKSGTKELKSFGRVVGGVFLALGLTALWLKKPSGPYMTGFGSVLVLLGFVYPWALKPLQKAWMTLAVCMGWVMTRVLLTVFFYAGVTSVALLGRLFGKKFLDLAINGRDSYWLARDETNTDLTRYEKQF